MLHTYCNFIHIDWWSQNDKATKIMMMMLMSLMMMKILWIKRSRWISNLPVTGFPIQWSLFYLPAAAQFFVFVYFFICICNFGICILYLYLTGFPILFYLPTAAQCFVFVFFKFVFVILASIFCTYMWLDSGSSGDFSIFLLFPCNFLGMLIIILLLNFVHESQIKI